MFRPPRGPGFRPGYGRPPRGHRGPGYRGGGGTIDPYLLLMLMRTLGAVLSVPGVPVVTLGVAGAQLALFFRELLPRSLLTVMRPIMRTGIGDVCLQPRRIVERMELWRLFTGGVFHADQYHVCYNMSSLLQKGAELERSRGSLKTLYYLAASYFLCQVFLLALSVGLRSFTSISGPYDICTVGFSGVLFALKIILTHGRSGSSVFFGVRIPVKYLAWAELLYIHLFVPRSSFLGHLCGILAGLILVSVDDAGGPEALFAFPSTDNRRSGQRRRGTSWGSGMARQDAYDRGETDADIDDGPVYSSDDDARSRSSNAHASTSGYQPTPEEMRQARLRRFENDSKKAR